MTEVSDAFHALTFLVHMNSESQRNSPSQISSHDAVPSWVVGICGVAAVASALFSILLFLNR
jgi:hypothetical protein